MHFTVIFESNEGRNWPYGLSFLPAPVWLRQGAGGVSGDNYLRVISPRGPRLQQGAVQELFDHQPGLQEASQQRRSVIVVTHNGGHAQLEDLTELIKDLESHDFKVTTCTNHSFTDHTGNGPW